MIPRLNTEERRVVISEEGGPGSIAETAASSALSDVGITAAITLAFVAAQIALAMQGASRMRRG